MNEIIPTSTIDQMAAKRTAVVDKLMQALELLSEGQSILSNIAGNYAHIIPRNFSHYDVFGFDRAKSAGKFIKEIDKSIWKMLLAKYSEFLPSNKRDQLDRDIHDGNCPVFEADTVKATVADMLGSLSRDFEKLVYQVYQYLTPQKTRLITNDKIPEVGEKCIIRHIVVPRFTSGYSVSYYRQGKLEDMDKVFHLLDGKGIPKYPNTLACLIENAGKSELETPYYHLKWFRNGNLHIKFKRMDLVTEVNKHAGNVLRERSI